MTRRDLAVMIAIGIAAIAIVDIAGYAFLPNSYARGLPRYRVAPPILQSYHRFYFKAHSERGFDIAEGAVGTHTVDGITYSIFANELGCFDRNTTETLRDGRYIYLAGDSFTWGYAPYETKFGTLLEQQIGVRVAKCGVTNTGTRQQFAKFLDVSRQIGTMPSAAIVAFYDNDIANDYAYPHTTVIEGFAVNTAYVRYPRTLELVHPALDDLRDEAQRILDRKPPRAGLGDLAPRYSLTYNIVSHLTNALHGIKPTDRARRFGYDFYHISAGDTEPESNPVFRYDDAEPAVTSRASLLAWKAHAVVNGYRLIVMTIPPKPFYHDRERYAGMHRFLAAHDIEHIDLPKSIADLPETALYYQNDEHLNVSGNAIVAGIMARSLSRDGADLLAHH